MRLIAAAKKVKTQEVNIHLKVKPDWYLEKINPEGKVPTIEHNGHLIRESLIAFGELNHNDNTRKSGTLVYVCVVAQFNCHCS